MTEPPLSARIVDELLRSAAPLDDDELADRLGVHPRQKINSACRRLQDAERLRRYVGTRGKIVNDVRRDDAFRPIDIAVIQERLVELPAGDSAAQRHAEGVMLDLLGERLCLTLAPRRFVLADGVRVEVDGADEQLTVLVEAWAHQGPPKSAQKHKVLADTLKLLYVASTLKVAPLLVLCLSDVEAAHHFTRARSWAAGALAGFGVQVEVVDLPSDVKAAVVAAQKRQYR